MRSAALAPWLILTATVVLAQPANVRDYLALFDDNGDGRVSQEEYLSYMMRGFHALDRNHDGVLDSSEVPPSRQTRLPITEADYRHNLIRAFQRQDRNRDGYLDSREMAQPPH